MSAASASSMSNLLLLLILVALGGGFFLTIQTIDLFRQREEIVVRELEGLRSDVGRLQIAVEGLASSGGAPTRRNPLAADTRPMARCSNAQTRDPAAEEGGDLVLTTRLEMQNMNLLLTPDCLWAINRRFHNVRPYTLGVHIRSFWTPTTEKKHRE